MAGFLEGKNIAVTGAGSGIGKAIAIQCARLGARLAICGRKVERLEETAAILRGLGAEVMVRPASVRLRFGALPDMALRLPTNSLIDPASVNRSRT